MWSKFSNAIRSLQEDTDATSTSQSQYPPNANTNANMTTCSNTELPPPIPNPPSSPSKQARRNVFSRLSKAAAPRDEGDRTPSPLKLPIGLPKKVKSHLHLNGNSSQASLSRISPDPRPSQDTLRSYQDPLSRPSQDSVFSPIDANNGSVRSILRDPKTPGTGQNVRFFSRDAYRVISPDQSIESEVPEPMSFLDRLQRAPVEHPEPHPNLSTGSGTGKRPLVTEIFAPVSRTPANDVPSSLESLMMPVPPPDLSNIFDMSQQCDVPNIPATFDSDIRSLDGAVELTDGETQGLTSTPYKKQDENQTTYHSMALSDVAEEGKDDLEVKDLVPTPPPSGRDHDRSHSFSFGQTVFHSLARSSGSTSDKNRLSDSSSIFKSRTRALSDGVFKRGGSTSPEADINDVSGADLIVYASPTPEPPDPFRINATTYYTPQTMIPPTPPKGATHTRSASKEEDIIWSLRTQLALQQELCAQYEIDLSARDELVQALTARCEKNEQEGERRRGVLRTWKKKVSELERVCRGLEGEVEKSREESWERSVMDEASGEALKCLQRRIETLEREKGEGERKAQKVLEEKERLENILVKFKEVMKDASDRIQVGGGPEDSEELKALVAKTEQASVAERERHRNAELEWEEEREVLIVRGAQVEADREELAVELAAAQEQLTQKDNEYGVLKSELEAQWQHTETMSEKMNELQEERDVLKGEVKGLERRIEEIETEWNESENRRTELESEIQETIDIKEAIEREKEELEQQLLEEKEHNDHITQTLQEQEGRIRDLDSERQFAIDNVSRLQNNIHQRDAEISDFSQRVVEREIAAEQLREEMTKVRREHARTVSEQARELQEMAASGKEARQQMEVMIRGKAEADVSLSTLKEQVTALKEEVERLRRQVHELQQESADKEVKIVQLTKQRSQDKEDMLGLNIALDSKQQELELLKRKLGVKGTAGSTPAQPSKIAHSRSSSAFSTPGITRPPSALSDTGKDVRGLETPGTTTKALGKSVRVNGVAPTSTPVKPIGSMGPPRPKLSRPSVGTPTPANSKLPASLARSSSAKSIVTPSIRRTSSTALEQARMKAPTPSRKISESPVPSELDEKENVDTPAPTRIKKRASVIAC